jgi:hypothetical protein
LTGYAGLSHIRSKDIVSVFIRVHLCSSAVKEDFSGVFLDGLPAISVL